ncbi:MAG: hypothetical protein AAGI30_08955, partial [Planctomycetota bacterium]
MLLSKVKIKTKIVKHFIIIAATVLPGCSDNSSREKYMSKQEIGARNVLNYIIDTMHQSGGQITAPDNFEQHLHEAIGHSINSNSVQSDLRHVIFGVAADTELQEKLIIALVLNCDKEVCEAIDDCSFWRGRWFAVDEEAGSALPF